jgi:hypothetical protein
LGHGMVERVIRRPGFKAKAAYSTLPPLSLRSVNI